MTTITTRSGKGSPLTNAEVDSNFTNLNDDKVEASGDSITGNLSFGDNNKAIFGAGSDLQIYHDGSNSYITEAGTGDLRIRGASVEIQTGGGNKYFQGASGITRLYHTNNEKFATTATGVNVTGSISADGLTVDAGSTSLIGTLQTTANNSSLVYSDSSQTLILKNDDASGTARLKFLGTASESGAITFGGGVGATSDTFAVYPRVMAGGKAFNITGGGDISFYEDTGTTAKLTWDASAETLNFADNGKAVFGAGSDLQIYHDGSNSYVKDAGTGSLFLEGTNQIKLSGAAGDYFLGQNNGSAYLYYAGALKLYTTSTGIDVTGTVVADGLESSGGLTFTAVDGIEIAGKESIVMRIDSDDNDANRVFNVVSGSSVSQETLINASEDAGVTLYYDNAAKIATTSTGIDVTGTVTADGLTVDGTATLGAATTDIFFADSFNSAVRTPVSTGHFYIQTASGSKNLAQFEDNNDISFYEDTGTTAKLFWDASAESLGIGTSSPARPLDVNGAIRVANANAVEWGGANEAIVGDTGGALIYKVGGSEVMRNTSTGVNVTGTVTADGLTVDASLATVASTGPNVDLVLTEGNTNTDARIRNSNGILTIDADLNNEFGSSALILGVDGTDRLKIDRFGDISFYEDTGTTAKLFWDASAESLGIGTSSPDELLHLSDTGGNAVLKFTRDDTTTTSGSTVGTIQFAHTDADNAGVAATIVGKATNAFGKVALLFATGSPTTKTERMRLDAEGNLLVGITSSPDALIHAQAPKSTYTDYATVFAGGTDSNNAQHGISLSTAGNSLAGIVGSNVSIDGSTFSQPTTARSSGYFTFNNITTAGDTSILTYSGFTKGTTTAVERFRVDGDGNLLVGTTDDEVWNNSANSAADNGHNLRDDGRAGFAYYNATANTNATVNVNRTGSDGDLIRLFKSGSTVGSISAQGGDLVIGNTSLGLKFVDSGPKILPRGTDNSVLDGTVDLGDGNDRFQDIYATNGTIQTSDRNEKQDIEELSDAEQRVAVACKGLLRKFRWKSAVEEKGDDARIHFGIIAQDLQDAFTAEGLDAGRYGMFINSTWTDEETGEERSRMGVRYSELLAFIIASI